MKEKSDEWYTPPEVMDCINDYVSESLKIDKSKFVRPFYPGGDYEHFNYPEDCIVVDNPPFSILTKIVDYYLKNNIKFFLFAPQLTSSSTMRKRPISCIIVKNQITYLNNKKLPTCFLTNIPKRSYMKYSTKLNDMLSIIQPENKRKDGKTRNTITRQIPGYINPNIISVDRLKQVFFLDEYDFIIKYNNLRITEGYIKKSP